MKNVRYALALFALIALCLTTSAAFADTTLGFNESKTVTVSGVDGYGNQSQLTGAYTFSLVEGGDVVVLEYVSPTSVRAVAGHKAGTATIAITDPNGAQIGTEHVIVPPGAPVAYSFSWQ